MLGILMFDIALMQASPVTIRISGVVAEVSGLEPYPYTETIYAGATFAGTYTYDSATIGSYQQPGRGRYVHDSPYGFNLSLGGFEFKTVENHNSRFTISVYNNFSSLSTYDGYYAISYENIPLSTGLSVHSINWNLYDYTLTALSSIALPSDAPDINAWSDNFFTINCGGAGDDNPLFIIRGTVTQAVLVPEPTTLLLLGLGGLLLRRKHD